VRTNHSGVTENAEYNIDKEKFDANWVHIFRKDICECDECIEPRNDIAKNAADSDYAIKPLQSK
jgi:hypothetical protein